MEDFAGKLLAFPKWHDKEFVNEQLRHHLDECFKLLETGDEHLSAELVDLIQITKVYLRQNLNSEQMDELYQKRFDKFMEKLNLDKGEKIQDAK